MDAKLEIEVLFKLVESLEKTLIAYNLSNNSGWVCGARKAINELKLAYRDWANSGLSEVLEKRLARSMREDVCHLLYHMSQVFNVTIARKGIEDYE